MALIKCIECGKEFSDKATACPNCGCPTSEMIEIQTENNVSKVETTSKQATERMLVAVETARSTAKRAEREFDLENSKIQRMASGSIGLFDNDTVTRVADISMAAKKACNELYSALQMALVTLDRECRPLLESKPDGSAIKDVYFEIKQLNSDSEISNTFGASLNYSDLGDVATRRYSPSLEAKMIENFWRSEYDKVESEFKKIELERKEKEKAIRKEAEEKQQKEREAFQMANQDQINEYADKNKKSISVLTNLEKQAYENKKTEIKKKTESEKEKVTASITETIEKECQDIQEKRNVMDKDYVKTVKELRVVLEDKKLALNNLSVFKFAEKKKLTNEVEHLVNQLQTTTNNYKQETTNLENRLNTLSSQKNERIKKECDKIEKQHTLPQMVEEPKGLKTKNVSKKETDLTPTQVVGDAYKEAIYQYMLTEDLVTIVDIITNCSTVADLTNQRVSSYVRQLLNEGRVERIEEKRKAYFRAIGGAHSSKTTKTKENGVVDLVEEYVKKNGVSFSQMKIKNKDIYLEDYEKYGYLKFLAIYGRLYCEEEGNDLILYYIPEEYRKNN